MSWQVIWAWLRTWEGAVPAAVAVAAAIYYGPRKMLETWDWYWYRFRDSDVLFVVEKRKEIEIPMVGLPGQAKPTWELPYTIQEIADRLQRTPKSIFRSLKRLRRDGKVELHEGGWRLKK